MQKGIEINFYDLFRHLMKKWAVLLVFVLIFGAAANFYGYHKAEMTARRERQALEEYALSIAGVYDGGTRRAERCIDRRRGQFC